MPKQLPKPKPPEHIGHWNAIGEWVATENEDDYWRAPMGSITRGVRQLVYMRRVLDLTPKRAAILIEGHHLGSAFPSREQWLDVPVTREDGSPMTTDEQWIQCWCRTSAEAALKYRGEGSAFKNPERGDLFAPHAVPDEAEPMSLPLEAGTQLTRDMLANQCDEGKPSANRS